MTRRQIARTASLVVLAGGVVAATTGSSTAAPSAQAAKTKTILLKDIAFKPGKVTVTSGTDVAFKFADGTTTHNVKSVGSPKFKYISNRSKGTIKRKLTAKGKTYRFTCTLHPGMDGSVKVK